MEDAGEGRRLSVGCATRRQFLVATAGIGAGSIAGCSSVTEQEFEATPVVVPEAAREEVALTEVLLDSTTVSQEVEQIDGEISVTNRIAAYARGPDRGSFDPSLIEEFIGRVNGTEGVGPAAVVSGGELDGDEGLMDLEGADYAGLMDFIGQNYDGLMDFIGQDYLESVTPDRISMVAPAGLRSDSGNPQGLLLLSPPESDKFNPPRGHPMYVVDAAEFFPTKYWFDRGQEYAPAEGWFPPKRLTLSQPFPDVLVVLGDNTPEEVFGVPEAEMPGERMEAGDVEEPLNRFLVAEGGGVPIFGQSPTSERYKNFFDVGVPAPTSATYRVGALSTPAAEVTGETVNPLAHLGFEEILDGSEFMARPKETFLGDSDAEWLGGPDPLADVGDADIIVDSPDATSIVGQDADLKSFVGVLSSDLGPLGIGLHVARVRREDNVVIVTGAHGWPVGSTDYFERDLGDRSTGILGTILSEARTLTAEAGTRFVLTGSVEAE